jgi:hypothetical protein
MALWDAQTVTISHRGHPKFDILPTSNQETITAILIFGDNIFHNA